GMLNNDYVPLFDHPDSVLQQIAETPAAALGSIRHRPSREECQKIFENFKNIDVRYFFYIGGNDSAETAYIINSFAAQENYDLRVIHIPKTIDNDLLVTDHCPGFGSAGRYVACAFIGDNEDNRSLKGVKINVVMGRNAGFLTAASILARQFSEDGPHLVYMPELPFDLDNFLADIDRVYRKHGRALIAVSEGINKQGIYNVEQGKKPDYISKRLGSLVNIRLPDKYIPKGKGKSMEVDSHGNVSLSGSSMLGDILSFIIKNNLDIKRVRADTLGYAQRSFPLSISEIDAQEAYRVGVDAVASAVKENLDEGSVAIKRIDQNGQYGIETFITPLQSVQKHTKAFPKEWIKEEGSINERNFRDYVSPLVGPLPRPGRFVKPLF
ncbi:MAG: 6-phosphofructokinase, partial [Spirochaetota bacterium]